MKYLLNKFLKINYKKNYYVFGGFSELGFFGQPFLLQF